MLAVLSAIGTVAVSGAAAVTSPGTPQRLPAIEAGILTQLNAVRAANGLRPLVLSDALQDAAVAHSRAMLQGGYFEHDSPDGTSFASRLRRYYSPRGFDTWSVAENLLFASPAVSPAEVINAWMQSPPHRENILTPRWHEVGIGTLQADSAPGTFGDRPTMLVTLDFGLRGRKSAGATVSAKP